VERESEGKRHLIVVHVLTLIPSPLLFNLYLSPHHSFKAGRFVERELEGKRHLIVVRFFDAASGIEGVKIVGLTDEAVDAAAGELRRLAPLAQ
jgi:hypothetical protein